MTNTVLDPTLLEVFGADDSPMPEVERRARAAYADRRIIVWEGDAQTFAFGYVGGDAEELLGHPASSWVETPDFWVRNVVHPDDGDDAVAFCALATAKCKDHTFRYRARTTAGEIVWLEDYVRVVLGPRGIPTRLRGVMVELPDQDGRHEFRPSPSELNAIA